MDLRGATQQHPFHLSFATHLKVNIDLVYDQQLLIVRHALQGCQLSLVPGMAYNRAAPKKQQNETLAVAAICLFLGYLACWFIQVPAKPKVKSGN